jgi:integrase
VANVNVRLSHISLLLGWAARNDMVPFNVAKGTSIPNPQAKKNRRKPFDLAALKAIFASPVYAKGERPAGGKGEAAYFLPVMALYTGARVRELAQLRHGDIKEVEYADADGDMHKGWFLSITEDTDDEGLANAIKNDASERLVPIHPKLMELGFIEYVQGLVSGRGGYSLSCQRISTALPLRSGASGSADISATSARSRMPV